ncbi:bis(5'-nucleosyl)-tetraphosphatase [asymmetrical] [Anabrus simplex]|uniref:bis(5'-nucleosyl)-tetraphosphatase [asymmetrical] n=1 Tax=Anabrus simplex TaxID=316456 RepID=UPI0034DD58D0
MALRAAGFVIFRRISNEIEYLLLQTSYGEHHWTPPKGHVDPGESDIETAWRETEEEAGLKKEHLHLIDGFSSTLKYDVNGRPKSVIYWLAELKKQDTDIKLSDEHQDFKWLSLDKACSLAGFPEMQRLFRDCQAFIEGKKQKC